ncbi:DUF2156 domain-containing protein [Candidatus Woesearchaeota archaeon]|nr:DUF2156 domain-containing protein [Candidatus Woesearchaeota archaeon]
MEVIGDIGSSKKEITGCIEKYGSVREHNYWFFCNQQTGYAKIFFFKFGDGGIISIRYKSGIWELIGELLAPEKKRLELLEQFLDYTLLTKKDKKVFMFVPEKFWKGVKGMLQKSDKYKITSQPAVYHTPVFNMENWDERLEGGKRKKLRNIRNGFLKRHNTEFVPAGEINKKKLIEIVHKWRKNRPREEMNYYTQMYLNFIKNDFEGTDIARCMVVNNEPCCITAGWKIPNSTGYYSAIGLYNYKHNGLGEVANIDDLTQIKNKKYKYADFGDSTESLLQFKKKFCPESFYRTYWFHIKRK